MPNIVLGLQGGSADGTEPTFDGQPMQPGVHLRWGFAPELGFPSYGFWLCRRVAQAGEQQIPLPTRLQFIDPDTGRGPDSITPGPGPNEWRADIQPRRDGVTVTGRVAEGGTQLLIETFVRDDCGNLVETGQHTVAAHGPTFRVRVSGHEIACIRVVGASSIAVG